MAGKGGFGIWNSEFGIVLPLESELMDSEYGIRHCNRKSQTAGLPLGNFRVVGDFF